MCASGRFVRFLLLALVAAAMPTAGFAQAQACVQIAQTLRSIDRNPLYASVPGIAQQLQARQNEVRQGEALWVRGGCQQAYEAGYAMSRECQSLARSILDGRAAVEQLTQRAQDGQALAQNRERMMHDYARLNCGAAESGVTIAGTRGSLLDNIFGSGTDYIESPYDAWTVQQTRRTVCVRTTDGFYWPISFSTTDAYIGQDAIRCHEMCPGTEVALFSYRNPGEEPEDMISLAGTPYRSMPYAFRFREEVDMTASCQIRETVGTVAMDASGGEARAVIDFGDLSFPLPQRDPRATVTTVAAAEAANYQLADVPLPRPRPGTTPATPAAQGGEELRLVDFGDRQVRIVGPETPYVPGAAEEP